MRPIFRPHCAAVLSALAHTMWGRTVGPKRKYLRRRMVALGLAFSLVLLLVGLSFTFAGGRKELRKNPGIELTANTVITLTGHGFGHGRGMGQWGAFGYSRIGYNTNDIIHHFYGEVNIAPINTPYVKVNLTREKVAQVYSPTGLIAGATRIKPGQALYIQGANAMVYPHCYAPGMAPLSQFPLPEGTKVSAIVPTTEDPTTMLRFCADNAPYRGAISVDNNHVYNTIAMEDYLRSVVPSEMPAKWADQGGVAALRAQAITARSYATAVMAASHSINDNDESQMYIGIRAEDPRSDAAVTSTKGLVLTKKGAVVLAEYSSSTGGQTFGGDFPSVIDAGDVISPYHTWTVNLTQQQLAQKLGITNVVSIQPTVAGPRSRLGTIILTCSSGQRYVIEEEDFARRFHLPSAWIDMNGPVKVITTPVVNKH